ncbi:MAG: hypothetical protein J6Y19_10275 [Kiritimatiellae bacterium]|nr:hypothetical protein [Kiritimatiellia bacterium]
MSLTPAQQRRFWQAFRPAWLAHAGRNGLASGDRKAAEEWRHRVTAEECQGRASVKELGNEDFDAIMLRFSQEAGDMAGVAYWAASAERRMRHLLARKLAELDRLEPERQNAVWYLWGVLRQSKLAPAPERLEDVPEEFLRKALQMLASRVRALRARGAEEVPF